MAFAAQTMPQEGEDVLAWIMRTRAMTFPEAVLFANELIEEDRDA